MLRSPTLVALAAIHLFAIFSSLGFGAAYAESAIAESGGAEGRSRTFSKGCLAGAATLLPFPFIAYWGYSVSWLQAAAFFVSLIVLVNVDRAIALALADKLKSVDLIGGIGWAGMILSGILAWNAIVGVRSTADRPTGELWPVQAKTEYINRCVSAVATAEKATASPYTRCKCIADSLEAEFGNRDFSLMLATQPDQNGSRAERRLYSALQACLK